MTTVYQICARPSHRLVVSWAVQGPGGEERRPCFLAQRLQLLYTDLDICHEEELEGRFRLSADVYKRQRRGRALQ